jgi:choline dehydrogenase-like flavoprotein
MDYDVLVIGSGFGGSVTALRLTEKGYRVGVLETGRRFADDEFAKTSWRLPLTITAQAERAMAFWPNRGEEDPRPALGAVYRRVAPAKPVVPSDAPGALRLPVVPRCAGPRRSSRDVRLPRCRQFIRWHRHFRPPPAR